MISDQHKSTERRMNRVQNEIETLANMHEEQAKLWTQIREVSEQKQRLSSIKAKINND